MITQNADFGNKMAAVREYNKLKQRITDKIDYTTKGDKISIPPIHWVDSENKD